MFGDHGYNLIVKAETVEEATTYINEWLSVPVEQTSACRVGYGEVIAAVYSDDDLSEQLAAWREASRAKRDIDDKFTPGALVWFIA